ncbi:hypothetical protein BMS3Bbin14_00372 [bacterium BMS3Bbin14]|nr:hypothetical protein BMS3Abin13_00089 [bacterium BMS3Abin13]GBE51914.1 hypothetical protein BMS3Bbin14_00372 [bacterium BMS3Bbin14]
MGEHGRRLRRTSRERRGNLGKTNIEYLMMMDFEGKGQGATFGIFFSISGVFKVRCR